jgi:cation transporter-like permease
MIRKLFAGFAGGMCYVLVTWTATLTGILEWYKNFDPDHLTEIVSIFAPFSLMAMFIFISIYLYHKWQPLEKQKKTFWKLMVIGSGFALGATVTQLSLMQIDGSKIGNSLIIAGLFFTTSILISLLISSFYLFIKKNAL